MAGSLSNGVGNPSVELPEVVKGVKLGDLDDLVTNLPALDGIWEKSDPATALYKHHCELARHNEAQTEHLIHTASEIEELRREIDLLAEKELHAHSQWQTAESQMQLATEGYSPAGIKQSIKGEISDLEQDARRIENKFRDGLNDGDDPIALAKQYVSQRRQYHYNRTLLDSLS